MTWFFIAILTAYAGFHAHLVWRLAAAFPLLRGKWLVALILACLALVGSTIASFWFGRASDHPRLAAVLAIACTTWAAFLWWFLCAGLLGEAWNLLARLAALFWPTARAAVIAPKPFLVATLALTGVAMAWALVEANCIRLKTVEIEVPHLAADARPIRIAQLTDTHLGMFMGEGRLERTLACVREAAPDVIVSTGDFTDSPARHYPNLIAMLAAIDAPLGKFAVTGNHEFFVGLEAAAEFHAQAGFRLLRGESVVLDGRLRLCGVDDPAGLRRGVPCYLDEDPVLPPSRDAVPTVFLKHQPRINEKALDRFDVQLSGHTHGGQIFPWHFLTRLQYEYYQGLYNLAGDSRLYVSRGAGTWGPPLRLFAPPEVTLIILKPAQE
jgi:predicted MPP superfamily phosphohydrolase